MAEKKKTSEKKARKRSNRAKMFLVLTVLIVTLVTTAFAIAYTKNFVGGKLAKVNRLDVDRSSLNICPKAKKELSDYDNILMLGIDTRDIENNEGSRSDAIMIVSINKISGAIKIASVYRDVYLYIPVEERFDKATHAHVYGGAQETMRMLNINLDLNIEKVIVVNWGSVAKVVDAMGGLSVDVKKNEIDEMNRYINDTGRTVGGKTDMIENPGYRKLDGIQAVTYARIRKGESGGDTARAKRMRKLLNAAVKKLKGMSFRELDQWSDEAMPAIKTDIDSKEILSLLLKVTRYDIQNSIGWPNKHDGWIMEGVWYDFPMTLERNVMIFHKKMFGRESYRPSGMVKKYSKQIEEKIKGR